MKRTHTSVQAFIVLTMIAFVSWPQYRPVVRAQSIWRYSPAVSQRAQADDFARADVGFGRASYISRQPAGRPETIPGVADEINPQYVTPISVAALGGRLNALVGFARTSLNMPIPYARLALRSIRTGRVEARATANDEGRFSFLDIDPSSYIVELLGPDGSVIATSEMVALARGDVRQTTVRMAASASKVASVFGNTLTGTISQTTNIAASSDVTRTTSNMTPQASPNNPSGGTR